MSRKRWDLDKEDQKGDKKGKEDKTWSYLNIPDPDRRKVSTFSSDKVSPILRPETKEMSRGQKHQHYVTMKGHSIAAHWIQRLFHTFSNFTSGITVHKGKIEAVAAYPRLNVKMFVQCC